MVFHFHVFHTLTSMVDPTTFKNCDGTYCSYFLSSMSICLMCERMLAPIPYVLKLVIEEEMRKC